MANIPNMILWAEALESDEFAQTKGALRTPSGHCCLGVACEVAMRNGVFLEAERDEDSGTFAYDNEDSSLPDAVISWLGLVHENPVIGTNAAAVGECRNPDTLTGKCGCGEGCHDLVEATFANDELGWTFADIAASLRHHYQLPEKEEKANA